MTNKRLSEITCDQNEFNKAKPLYEEAISESNQKASLRFDNSQYNNKRNISSKVIRFNSPFTRNFTMNICKTYLKPVKQDFPKHHKMNETFNKNTEKLIYYCMKNMSSIINQHNVKILSAESKEKRSCNCKKKNAVLSRGIA